MEKELQEELIRIGKAIEEGNCSYSELAFLQDHKQEVLEIGDIGLCEQAGITEEEYNAGKLSIFNRIIFSALDEEVVNNGYGLCQKYEVELLYNGNSYTTHFTDSVMAYREDKELDFKDVMYCLLSDANAYNTCEDIDDFQANFGYEKASELLKAYNGCKEVSEGLKRLFTEEELEELQEEFQDY